MTMRKTAVSVLTALSLLLLPLSGCGSGESGGADSAEPIVLSERYEAGCHALYREHTFYGLENGRTKVTSTHTFSAPLEEDGETWEVTCCWCVSQGELSYRADDSLPDRCVLESIPGCTSHLLLRVLSGDEGPDRFFLCNLAENRIEPVLEELQADCFVSDLHLSADLSRAVLETDRGEGACYWDGDGVVDLAAACKVTLGEQDLCSALLLEDGVLFSVIDRTDAWAPLQSCWFYRWEDGSVEQTVDDVPRYLQGYQEDGLTLYGGAYGTLVKDGVLQVLNLRTGEQVPTEVSAGAVSGLWQMTEDAFLVLGTDGTVTLLDGATGKTLCRVETGQAPEEMLGRSCFDGSVLAVFSGEDGGTVLYRLPLGK